MEMSGVGWVIAQIHKDRQWLDWHAGQQDKEGQEGLTGGCQQTGYRQAAGSQVGRESGDCGQAGGRHSPSPWVLAVEGSWPHAWTSSLQSLLLPWQEARQLTGELFFFFFLAENSSLLHAVNPLPAQLSHGQ